MISSWVCGYQAVGDEQVKGSVIAVADAVQDVGTVMVHPKDAMPALRAVVRSVRLPALSAALAVKAVLKDSFEAILEKNARLGLRRGEEWIADYLLEDGVGDRDALIVAQRRHCVTEGH